MNFSREEGAKNIVVFLSVNSEISLGALYFNLCVCVGGGV